MHTIFDAQTRNELVERINGLSEASMPQWGKMNVYQMLKHCTLCEEMYLGKTSHKRVFIGRLFGKIALSKMLKDAAPMQRNAPTNSAFIVTTPTGDVAAEKKKWIDLIRAYEHYNNPVLEHWFFGKMSKEQVGQFVYKHTDHHLRQFNA